jgi:hypothetical protein
VFAIASQPEQNLSCDPYKTLTSSEMIEKLEENYALERAVLISQS